MACRMAHHSHPQTLFKFLSHLTLFHLSRAPWYIDTFLRLLLKWWCSKWLSLDLLSFSPCILSRETSPILMEPSNIILTASGSFHRPHPGSLQEDHIHHVFSYILHTQPFQTTSSLWFLHISFKGPSQQQLGHCLPSHPEHDLSFFSSFTNAYHIHHPKFCKTGPFFELLHTATVPSWVKLSTFHLGRSNFTSPIFLRSLVFLKSTVTPQRISWSVKLVILFSCLNPFKTILLIQFSGNASLFIFFFL